MNRQFNTTVKRELFVWNNILVVQLIKGHNCGLIPTSQIIKKNGKFSAIGYTLQLVEIIWKTAANPGETFTVCAEKYFFFFFALYRMKFDLV